MKLELLKIEPKEPKKTIPVRLTVDTVKSIDEIVNILGSNRQTVVEQLILLGLNKIKD